MVLTLICCRETERQSRRDRLQSHPAVIKPDKDIFSSDATLCCYCEHTATPSGTEPTAYLKVVQTNANIPAHLEKSRGTGLVQQDVDGDLALCACLMKILKDIQVRQGVSNYGNHLQWKNTEVI